MVTPATGVIISSLSVFHPSFNLSMFFFTQSSSTTLGLCCKKPLCLCVSVQDAQMTTALPDDSCSVLIDDTSSQWSSTADSEEERRSALEKSMYVFGLFDPNGYGVMTTSHATHTEIAVPEFSLSFRRKHAANMTR